MHNAITWCGSVQCGLPTDTIGQYIDIGSTKKLQLQFQTALTQKAANQSRNPITPDRHHKGVRINFQTRFLHLTLCLKRTDGLALIAAAEFNVNPLTLGHL